MKTCPPCPLTNSTLDQTRLDYPSQVIFHAVISVSWKTSTSHDHAPAWSLGMLGHDLCSNMGHIVFLSMIMYIYLSCSRIFFYLILSYYLQLQCHWQDSHPPSHPLFTSESFLTGTCIGWWRIATDPALGYVVGWIQYLFITIYKDHANQGFDPLGIERLCHLFSIEVASYGSPQVVKTLLIYVIALWLSICPIHPFMP